MWFHYTVYDLMFNGTDCSVECDEMAFDSLGNPHRLLCFIGDLYLDVSVDSDGSNVFIENNDCEVVFEGHYSYTDLRSAFIEALNVAHRLLDPHFLIAVEMDLPKRDHEQLTLI